jgi:hypothetical protein
MSEIKEIKCFNFTIETRTISEKNSLEIENLYCELERHIDFILAVFFSNLLLNIVSIVLWILHIVAKN